MASRIFSIDSKTKKFLVNFPYGKEAGPLLMIYINPGFDATLINGIELLQGTGKTEGTFRLDQNGHYMPGLLARFVTLDEEGAEERGCLEDISELQEMIQNAADMDTYLLEELTPAQAQWFEEDEHTEYTLNPAIFNARNIFLTAYRGSANNNNYKERRTPLISLEKLGIIVPEDLLPMSGRDVVNTLAAYYTRPDAGESQKAMGKLIEACDDVTWGKLLKGFEADFRRDLKLARKE